MASVYSGGLCYNVPVLEFLSIDYLHRRQKFLVTFLSGDYIMMRIYMSHHAFLALREQCRLVSREGIYARFSGNSFCYTVLGDPVRNSEYRLLRDYDPVRKRFYPHVPVRLPPPKPFPVHESLLDE